MSDNYVGVDGVARKVSSMYVGVDGVARKVTKGYVGVNGVARQFYKSTLTIGDLSIGDTVLYGTYKNEPIVWVVADINYYESPNNSVTLVTVDSLRNVVFDAIEDESSLNNSRYRYSNIRQWLNSNGAANVWWKATHSLDTAPTVDNVNSSDGAYHNEAGFMTNFTDYEKSVLLDTKINAIYYEPTGTASVESLVDKFYLLSCSELGFDRSAILAHPLALLQEQKWRMVNSTTSYLTRDSSNWSTQVTHHNQSFNDLSYPDGVSTHYAYNSDGLRVACNINPDTELSWDKTSDGHYILL